MRSIVARFERLGLQRRIMLYVSAGLVVFSAIFGFVALQAVQQSTDLVLRERLLIARAEAQQIDGELTHVQGELDDVTISLASALVANNLTNAQGVLRALYTHWNVFHRFENPCNIFLTDSRGKVLLTEPVVQDFVRRDLAQLPYLQNAFQSQRATISAGIALDGSTQPAVAFAVPIRAGAPIVGWLVGEVDRAHIGQRIEPSLDVGELGYAVEVIDDQGLVIATNTKGKEFSTSPHLKLIASFLRTGQSGVQLHKVSLNGEDRNHVVAFAPLKQISWGVLVEQEVDEALALPRNLQTEFIVFGILALGGGLALAWVTTRTVVRPVKALIHASQEIARGDLDHPLDVSGRDEVGALARTFDAMRAALRASREEIAGWNRELEARVRQRTRELAALVESSHALTSTLDLDGLFEILMKETREVLPSAEGVALFLFEPRTQVLAVRSTFGLDSTECVNLRFRRDEAIAGKVFESQTSALLSTAAQAQGAMANFSDDNRAHFLRAVSERAVQSAMGVPLVSKGARLGALTLYNFSHEGAFAERDVPLLQALANQAATAIENARLYQEASEVGALRELNRLKSEFVARASHELRTPITAIKSLAESLLRRDLHLDLQTQREFLEGIDAAADRLGGIVEQLLTLSRIEAGKLQIRREPMDVGAILARVADQLRVQMPTREIDLHVSDELPRARGDAERVEDVLTNLISNALKYSDADQPVEIDADTRADEVVISITDHGIGIPNDERERIFDRFYRVDNARTRRVGGAGLGLHICKTYVEAMGGTIGVESNDGRGSVFTFSLPVNKT